MSATDQSSESTITIPITFSQFGFILVHRLLLLLLLLLLLVPAVIWQYRQQQCFGSMRLVGLCITIHSLSESPRNHRNESSICRDSGIHHPTLNLLLE